MRPYPGVDYKSPYLIVNSVASYPPLLQREIGGVGKISHIGWAETVFKERHGVWLVWPYDGVDYNSPYLIVKSAIHPHYKERGGLGKISPFGWAHLYLSANFQNNK
jgi:hypothetical protein